MRSPVRALSGRGVSRASLVAQSFLVGLLRPVLVFALPVLYQVPDIINSSFETACPDPGTGPQ